MADRRAEAGADAGATALITMGGQAQVVTFALDALLDDRARVEQVIVLHMRQDDGRVRRALAQLASEFAGERYRGQPMGFRHIPVRREGRPLQAIETGQDAEAVWTMARELLSELKRDGRALHLCIAGGPRLLALTLTSAAMLQCDHLDRLWHLYTPREFLDQARDGAILHAPPDAGVRLVPVPLAPLGAYFPALRALSQPVAPGAALDPGDVACCRAACTRLTGRQRDVLEALASGLQPQEAADRLGITLSTLDAHKSEIYAECRVAWGMPEGRRLSYHWLREKFGPWCAMQQSAHTGIVDQDGRARIRENSEKSGREVG